MPRPWPFSWRRYRECRMPDPSLDPRKIGLERGEAVEIVGRSEQVDIRERRLHAARDRRVVAPAEERVEPDDAAAAQAEAPHLGAERSRLAGGGAVRDAGQGGARVGDAACGPTI